MMCGSGPTVFGVFAAGAEARRAARGARGASLGRRVGRPPRADGAAASGGHAMEITEVRVFPVNEEKLKAYVTITLDGCFVVRDLKVIHGNTGLFIAMPAKRRKDGTFKDIAHPLNAETRERMERAILAEYERELRKEAGVGAAATGDE